MTLRMDMFKFAGLLICAFVNWGCGSRLDSQYGVLEIGFQDGGKVYFKREARGLNYDTLTISADADHCAIVSDRDYSFLELGPHILYFRNSGKKLEIFGATPVALPKLRSVFSERIQYHQLDPLQSVALRKDLVARGLSKLEVPIQQELRCSR